MNKKINIVDLGKMDYKSAWGLQKKFQERVLNKLEEDTLFLVEHEPVYTLGKNADRRNLLEAANSDVSIYDVERGGDITYHGPGQLVGYPILNLNNYKTDSDKNEEDWKLSNFKWKNIFDDLKKN